jgi:hypothetical protein
METLVPIPSRHIDYAWSAGASSLGESCIEECTPDQLKMLIAREERFLVRMDAEGKTVGWAAFRIDNLPNLRVLFVTNIVAHNGHFERFCTLMNTAAKDFGCSRVRMAAKEAQARLFRMRFNASAVYTVMEMGVENA